MIITDEAFLNRLTLLVDKNIYRSDLSSSVLANEFCISQRHFNRRVKAITGKDTPHFIRSRRISFACTLLTQTTLSISEIYVKCGIESANYFSRVFKTEMGMTPTAYRNCQQK